MPDEALPTSTPKSVTPKSVTPKPKRRVLRRVVWIAVIGLALAGGARWYAAHKTSTHDTSAKTADVAVPVDVAAAARRDFPVFLNGLGVTQAWNTVTIRVRVDGQIDKIGFKEGQMVKQGDLLLEIDPRPFQAALDQAVAKKALDETILANSKRDLERYNKVGTLAVSQQQIDTQAALVKQQESAGQIRPGRHRQRASAARLHHHHRADLRPRRVSGSSTRATSCTPPIRRASPSSPSCSRSRWCSPRPRKSCRASSAHCGRARCR